VAGLCFSLVSSINKTDRHYITEILLKVALNTTNQPINQNKNSKKILQNLFLVIYSASLKSYINKRIDKTSDRDASQKSITVIDF
jgi:hypothetical protein